MNKTMQKQYNQIQDELDAIDKKIKERNRLRRLLNALKKMKTTYNV